ncbi:flavin reductase [Rhodococcus koreensis]
MKVEIDGAHFRRVLGQYPTGVVVVTAVAADGEPIGMTVGSFTSVSLNPPLVAFLPDKRSSSWKALRDSGDRFCINVLGADQEDICRAVAIRKERKFEGIAWRPSTTSMPILEGAVAYLDCTLQDIHDAGDHHIVVGRVHDLDVTAGTSYPLLFFQGGYGSFTPLSLTAGDADLLDQLRLVDQARPHMEKLAQHLDTEVTAIALVGDELVLAASAGRAKMAVAPTRVGQRVPFMPPLGSVHAAWGGGGLENRWIANLGSETTLADTEEYRHVAERVRRQGYAVTHGHEAGAHLDQLSMRLSQGDPQVSPTMLRAALREAATWYNPNTGRESGSIELRSLAAPVFDSDARVAFTLTLWGPPGRVRPAEVDHHAQCLRMSAAAATASVGGRVPNLA